MTFPQRTGVPVMQYVPSTGRYILLLAWETVFNVTNETTWEIYDSPHPWGPFTKINGPTRWKPQGFFNPVPLARTVAGAMPNGKPMTLIFAGDYRTGEYYQLWSMPMTVNTH